MGKPINKQLSSVFHGMINKILDDANLHIIKQDIDSALIYIPNFEVTCLFEIKRSYVGFQQWKPFEQDDNNYCALYRLKERAEINKIFVLYYKKEKLNEGIQVFELVGIENSKPKFEKKELYDLNSFKTTFIKNISKKETAIIRETNLQGENNQNSIYYYLNTLTNAQNHIYIEKENNWIILISSKKDFMPRCLYREMTGDLKIQDYVFFTDFTDITFQNLAKR